jgi:heptosyltransferase-2
MSRQNILVWLPSPVGDAVMATPTLAAIRNLFGNNRIFFCANRTVAEVLTPCRFADEWIVLKKENPFAISGKLKKYKFDTAILLKNSFASALAVFLAAIPERIGYARECRGFFLIQKLYPPKISFFRYKPVSAVDYYLAVALQLGCRTADRKLELEIAQADRDTVLDKFGGYLNGERPVIILVPGGAFGVSKLWPAEKFAKTADLLAGKFSANIFISVSPDKQESQIAEKICSLVRHPVINLAQNPVTLGQLKALFSFADLVITNDTGPRHIAIAFGRKIITLFGPNNPAWTESNYPDEVKIISDVPCAPCDKPVCKKDRHYCMEAITVEAVCKAAEEILERNEIRNFIQISRDFFVRCDFTDCFKRLGLEKMDDIFSFSKGKNLTKDNLADFRQRIMFDTDSPKATLFLKRYQNIPKLKQKMNWLTRRRKISMMDCDRQPAEDLQKLGINTPQTIAYGQQWQGLFENRSFIITEKIPASASLEEKLPDYFLHQRKNFIRNLAAFIRKFHKTGYRHRDLYLCHIFCNSQSQFTLIDLNRAFKPRFFSERYLIKDLAQLYYSAPGGTFTKSDRLRFFLAYLQKGNLSKKDKIFIKKVKSKAQKIAKHDRKHGKKPPFEEN